jgi:outer membrane murein-binding lipoprotein Lpp
MAIGVTLLAGCAHEHRTSRTSDDDTTDTAEPPDAGRHVDAHAPRDSAAQADADAPSDSGPDAKDDGGTRSRCDQVIELRAHGAQTLEDSTPYTAPNGGDHYEMFWFAPSWSNKMHLIEVEPLPDNGSARAWLLYMQESAAERPGSHQASSGLQRPDTALLATWTSQLDSMPIPSDVGIKVVQGTKAGLALEIHYYASPTTTDRADRSGVRLCVTSSLRPKEAALHWLGTSAIDSPGPSHAPFRASGQCTPKHASQLLAFAPRMGRRGQGIEIVARQNQADKVLVQHSFDATDPRLVTLPSEVTIRAGDVLTTTCTYDPEGAFKFGPGVEDELCYALVLAWPAGSLTNGAAGLFGRNNCIDGL